MSLDRRFSTVKAELDEISPSFCLAKWLQVTLHLQNGFNHSCHHPDLHKIPEQGLSENPGALHNTPFKKKVRAQMLAGKRPKECEYCWKVEDTRGEHFSDRVLKSADTWAFPRFAEIAGAAADANVDPSYVEVSFGNECNFRCSYCTPHISSSLWSSFEKHGAFVGRMTLDQIREAGRAPIRGEGNPYVKAFWDWFPSLVPSLKVFRITGGEPLINPNTYRVLDYLEAHPQPHLQLCINSNFGIPEPYFRKFLDKVTSLTKGGKIGEFMVFTSVDTHGEHAEYLRTGLKYDEWLRRVRTYLDVLPWKLTYMVTFNALSPARFPRLLDDLVAVNRDFLRTFDDGKSLKRTHLDISHLTHPEYFSPWVLTPRWLEELDLVGQFMADRGVAKVGPAGFDEYEIHKMRRIVAWARSTAANPPRDPAYFRALFALFTKQYEMREGKKFLDVFPEMEDFHGVCEAALGAAGGGFVRQHVPPQWHSSPANL